MLRVVAICAVAFGCHLIVTADSDTKDDNYLTNETFIEELATVQAEIQPDADDKDENHKEESFCSQPPDIDGVISPVLEAEAHPVGTIISYQCKFGYVSRSSGSLLSICRVDRQSGKAEWTYPNTTCIPRSCGDPGYVVNGRRIGNLFTFPNNVKFECVEGYKLQGLKDRYCQASGEWSGKLPTCIRIRCPVPSNPVNGRVSYISLDYGSELEYECDKGFMLKNISLHKLPRICSNDGRWSNNSPECIETTCEIPEAPDHGSVQLSGEPKVGTLAFYSCTDDTTLVGASTSKCLKTGEWTFDTPKCLRSCFVSVVQDGEIGRYQYRNRYRQDFVPLQIGERVKHNEIVTIRCKDGYIRGNVTNGASSEVTCNDGTWSELLLCHPILCTGEPPPTKNASPKIASRVHGKSIWYECDPGYQRTRKGQVVCKYGKWEGYIPVCEDYRCHMKELNYPGLVKPQRNFLKHGRNFTIVCDKAYTKSWKKEALCIKGKWDVIRNPCTIKTCEKEPPALNNGEPRYFTRINGSVVDYECLKDYEMVGNSSVICAFGEWEGQPPICQPSVNSLETSSTKESVANRAVAEAFNHTLNSFRPEECFCTYDHRRDLLAMYWRNAEIESRYRIEKGEKVLLICRYANMDIVWPNGLRFFERVELMCDVCQDWQVHDLPECETRVPGDSFILHDHQLKVIPGGIIEVPKSERVSLTCINPWLPPTWNVAATKTVRFNESLPPAMQTGFFMKNIIIDEMDYEHIGSYECFAMHGNQKQKSTIVYLKISGFQILCPELSTETNQGSFEISYSNERNIHSIAHYTCKDPQKRIVGPSERTCLENGRWSFPYPACADIRCPLLNDNSIFRITFSNNMEVNSIASYACKDDRQRLIGSSNRTCLHSGEWSGINPVCEDISCPEFPRYNGLSVSYSKGTKVDSIASFNCLNHATLVGNTSSTCLRSGMWSHPKPSCEMLEIHCPKIDGKGIFTIKYTNGRSVNSTAQFFCKELNQKVAGCNFVTCQQNGEWSGDYPTCVDYESCDLFSTPPNLNVFYTDDGRVGSIASFKCSPPTTLIGSSYSRCLSNSSWSRSLPTCAAPNCSIDELAMSLPLTVYPNMINVTSEFVAPGSKMPLICEDYLILTGSSTALCNFQGKWEITDTQCITACLVNKDESSDLIVEPVKDYYRFGEFVLLACPPGQILTSDVERIMCLGRTWSDPLPDCTLSTLPEPNNSGFTQTTTESD